MEEKTTESVRKRGRRPKGHKRTPEQHAHDVAFCSKMFLRGYTYRDIADALNAENLRLGIGYSIDFSMVYYDIQQTLISWKREKLSDINDYIIAELHKLDKLEVEAWEAWEKSKTGKAKKKSRNSHKPNKMDAEINEPDYYGYSEDTTETSAGNPKFLDLILNVQQRRAKMLGFDAPIKFDPTGADRSGDEDKVKYDISDVPKDLLFAIVDKMQNAEYERIAQNKSKPN